MKEKKTAAKESKEKKSTDLYVMIQNFFVEKTWKEYKYYDKSKNSFMINKRMAISFPEIAACLSRNKIQGHLVVDFWKTLLTKLYRGTPTWLFTKSIKTTKSNNPQKDVSEYSDSVLSLFYKLNDCSYKELNELFRRYPQKVISELDRIEIIINQSGKKS